MNTMPKNFPLAVLIYEIAKAALDHDEATEAEIKQLALRLTACIADFRQEQREKQEAR